ncbi:hypothetical protein DM02DRAFT_642235 [Periconia macrospinosa]|uniref:Transcription factor domain-containing protein n=1 Tax=Periconia macrospinosa TaxID=97972 RepID=A0A2V1DS84_9PLEO|nr:hypothetical protein DM02DRAFT_642235 [Periconia macrospinosa]
MNDAGLFHALLCKSALFGLRNSIVQRKHMLESIRLINGRLQGDGATSDATITAILFMAKAEFFQMNHGAWSVHMDGVRKIVELRGGIRMLSRLIQQNIYSTDLLGCMEIGAVPHFPTTNLPKPSLLSEIPMQHTFSPATHDIPNLQYRLLYLYSKHQSHNSLTSSVIPTTLFCSQAQQMLSEIIQELLLIGTLLFISVPHMCALPPIRPVDYGYLLSRLNSLATPLFNDPTLLRHSHFLLWLSFLGEFCFDFALHLRTVSAMLKIASWEEMKMALDSM